MSNRENRSLSVTGYASTVGYLAESKKNNLELFGSRGALFVATRQRTRRHAQWRLARLSV